MVSAPFDLWSLEVFVAVCDHETMAAAARALGLTQPAVSQIIAELESRTDAMLFDRRVRPIGLTPAGAVLRSRATALLGEARQIAPLLREVQKGRLPVVRIGLLDSLNRTLAAPLAEHLMALTDHASLLSGLTAAHAGALLTRRLDVVFAVDDLGDIEGLERWDILAEPYVLLTPQEMPVCASPDDLQTLILQKPFIRFSERSKTGIEIERHLRRLGLDLARSVEFDTPNGVTAMVASGQGWAITTPLCVIEAGFGLNGMRCTRLPGPTLRRRVILAARRRELGRLPQSLATFSATRLRDHCLPEIAALMPFVAQEIEIG
jgi:DNA-binding transcriptional LysR family regulator